MHTIKSEKYELVPYSLEPSINAVGEGVEVMGIIQLFHLTIAHSARYIHWSFL